MKSKNAYLREFVYIENYFIWKLGRKRSQHSWRGRFALMLTAWRQAILIISHEVNMTCILKVIFNKSAVTAVFRGIWLTTEILNDLKLIMPYWDLVWVVIDNTTRHMHRSLQICFPLFVLCFGFWHICMFWIRILT